MKNDSDYRPSVGVVLMNQDNKVLIARRSDGVDLSWPWQFPQGGIDDNEDPSTAALRELQEETGITSAQIITSMPQWLYYDLPKDLAIKSWGGKYKGQKQKWFLCKFLGDDSEINLEQTSDSFHAEFDSWEWIDLTESLNRVVPFKMDVYKEVVSYFSKFFK